MPAVPPPGALVTLRNLVSHPELNGRTATVLTASHSKEAAGVAGAGTEATL